MLCGFQMDIDELIKSRAHRILKSFSNYHSFGESASDSSASLAGYSLEEDEHPLGIYENAPDNHSDNILVTTRGLHLLQEPQEQFIQYLEIDRIEVTQPKQLADSVVLHLRSGNVSEISIKGGRGNLRDVWEFVRYLRRVMEDVQKQAPNRTK